MVCTVTNKVPIVCEHTYHFCAFCTSGEHSILSEETDNFSTTSSNAVNGLNPGVIYEPVEYDHAGDRSPEQECCC